MTNPAIPVPSDAAPRPTERAFAPKAPTTPPIIPPRPRSTFGDSEALKVMLEVNSSLAIAIVVDKRPVLSVEVVVVPPGEFIVEKFPTAAVIVPVEIDEMFASLAISVVILNGSGIISVPVETVSVEKYPLVAYTFGVKNWPVYKSVLKGTGPFVKYPAHPVLASGDVN
jgi:hypothetical protein